MVKIFFITAFLLSASLIHAQEQYLNPGTIKASATIAPANSLNSKLKSIYLNGFLGYQLEKHFSLRGETFVFLKNAAKDGQSNPIKNNYQIHFGAFYHLGIKNWDNYIGFQPGIQMYNTTSNSKFDIAPTFAAKIGTAYYVWKYFHFFAEVSYINAFYQGIDVNGRVKSDELAFSAGLGFQINTLKK